MFAKCLEWNYYLVAVFIQIFTTGFLIEFFSRQDPSYRGAQFDKIDKNSNFEIKVEYFLEKIITHPIFEYIYDKVKNSNATEKTFSEWKLQIIENFKLTYKTDYPAIEITYNIKSGILWTNKEIDFLDSIFHEIYIPYVFYESEEDQSPSSLSPIKDGILIRLVVVNGYLKLQVGGFLSEGWSPEFYRSDFPYSFRTHETITQFPLIYTCWDHGLPSRYLNLKDIYSQYYKDTHFFKKKRNGRIYRLGGAEV